MVQARTSMVPAILEPATDIVRAESKLMDHAPPSISWPYSEYLAEHCVHDADDLAMCIIVDIVASWIVFFSTGLILRFSMSSCRWFCWECLA
jgi:hypothetical protein